MSLALGVVQQEHTQEGMDPIRKNLNRSESTAHFFGGVPDLPGYAYVVQLFEVLLNVLVGKF